VRVKLPFTFVHHERLAGFPAEDALNAPIYSGELILSYACPARWP